MADTKREKLVKFFRAEFADEKPMARETPNNGHSLDSYLEAQREAGTECFAEEREQISRAHVLTFD